jgi:hypothetical protein
MVNIIILGHLYLLRLREMGSEEEGRLHVRVPISRGSRSQLIQLENQQELFSLAFFHWPYDVSPRHRGRKTNGEEKEETKITFFLDLLVRNRCWTKNGEVYKQILSILEWPTYWLWVCMCVCSKKEKIPFVYLSGTMMKQKENKLHSDKPSLSCLKYFFLSFSHHSSLISKVIRGETRCISPTPLLLYSTVIKQTKTNSCFFSISPSFPLSISVYFCPYKNLN